MKKALLLIVIVVVAVYLGFHATASTKANRAADVAWPASLGTIDEVPKRFPPAHQNAAATKLVALASAADIDFKPKFASGGLKPAAPPKVTAMRKALGEYTKAQLERTRDAIDAPPAVVASYLASRDAALNAVRDHLLSGQPVVWETNVAATFDAPVPNLLGHMHLHRALTARAFVKAQAGDSSAWDDLHASWELNRGLWQRPDLISILIAVASTRMINSAARKMPLPAPAWVDEVFRYDYTAAMAASQQAEAWTFYNLPVGRRTLRDVLRGPWYALEEAEMLDAMRTYTTEAVRVKACDADGPEFAPVRASLRTTHIAVPNLIQAWHRVLRFRAELEATQRVLQLRAGQTPSTTSQCSDGAWQITENGIRFSRDIKVPPQGIRFPLEYVR